MEEQFCGNGHTVEQGSIICSRCGSRVDEPIEETSQTEVINAGNIEEKFKEVKEAQEEDEINEPTSDVPQEDINTEDGPIEDESLENEQIDAKVDESLEAEELDEIQEDTTSMEEKLEAIEELNNKSEESADSVPVEDNNL